jgi:hypothetical protein
MRPDNYLDVIKKVKVLNLTADYYFILGERFIFLMVGARSNLSLAEIFVSDGRAVYNVQKIIDPYLGEKKIRRVTAHNYKPNEDQNYHPFKIQDYVVDCSELLTELFPKNATLEFFNEEKQIIDPFKILKPQKNKGIQNRKIQLFASAFRDSIYLRKKETVASVVVNYQNTKKEYLIFHSYRNAVNSSTPMKD